MQYFRIEPPVGERNKTAFPCVPHKPPHWKTEITKITRNHDRKISKFFACNHRFISGWKGELYIFLQKREHAARNYKNKWGGGGGVLKSISGLEGGG